MWRVPYESLKMLLPQGFSLQEEEHFVHLFHEDEKIASFFCTCAHPEILRAVADAYKGRIKH